MIYKNRQELPSSSDLTLAPIWKRGLAFFIDFLLVVLIIALLDVVFQLMGYKIKHIEIKSVTHMDVEGDKLSEFTKNTLQAIFISVPLLYFSLMIFFTNGITLGKKLLKLRVISLYHHRIGFWHSVERSLGYAASSLEMGLGFIQAFWNPNRMSLHDKIAETIVVSVKHSKIDA
jgi:uncharacterized RDD family membrane protein YckC